MSTQDTFASVKERWREDREISHGSYYADDLKSGLEQRVRDEASRQLKLAEVESAEPTSDYLQGRANSRKQFAAWLTALLGDKRE